MSDHTAEGTEHVLAAVGYLQLYGGIHMDEVHGHVVRSVRIRRTGGRHRGGGVLGSEKTRTDRTARKWPGHDTNVRGQFRIIAAE